MKKGLLTPFVAGVVLASSASASLLFYEGFDYTVGTDLATLGPSTENPNFYGEIDTNGFGSGTNQEIQIVSGSVPGANASPFASTANSFSWGPSLWANGFAELDSAISADATADYYFSFLARASATNSLLISFEISNGGNQRLQAGVEGSSFFATSADPAADTGTGGTFNVDTTYFIVGKMSIGATDTISMAAFGPGDSVPTAEPATWTATGSSAITGSGTLSRLRFRAYGGDAGQTVLDEVRFGTSWDAVAVPEPSSYGTVVAFLALSATLLRRRCG